MASRTERSRTAPGITVDDTLSCRAFPDTDHAEKVGLASLSGCALLY